ncbi:MULTISPECIES: lysine N(6)-hydroxylase/L-ornithine N(5)-oxygenase family protein [unclassified Cupriavidus]|uniref:lysine N(6)-hydroxylase/L-ornithine N(5)-oxygenase family protein n=1 Tax=unclassified Cupriavidus TaxID=2640874 RepID=UPI0010F724B8|nr:MULTISPECIES: lysine N(6)-hydroxylase/L-ornithine N(5)-oxygenase family protein [unclassified Cupriavidus]MWL86923.1 SidA/IucD/PvdA family monooxygenase [Cupriavidus sp. SW-Y-13]
MQVHDLIGVGFGPSNVALAIALEEQCAGQQRPDAFFIEKQPAFAWHPDMLLDNSHMQISFLKDLATLRNPASRFTFIGYLHQKGRLQDFINLKTFFPSRHEFNDYLSWAASHFQGQCAYGEEVVEVTPEHRDGEVALLRVRSRTADGETRERLGRNLVVGVGGSPNIPDSFRALRDDARVLHSSQYLRRIAQHAAPRRIAVIGAGQSAAELFMDLHGRYPEAQIDLVVRAHAIRPSDNSPFVNEIFNADYVDHVFHRPEDEREAMLREFWHTNYACPDLELIESIFKVFYEQRVRGDQRHRLLRRHEVCGAQADTDSVRLDLRDLNAGRASQNPYDLVVLATGYAREQHRSILAQLEPWVGECAVDRDYRVLATPGFRPGIFLQGACETSHGISDTLLSVTAIRTGEITTALEAAGRQSGRSFDGERRAATIMA